jgi:hypothetical protein
MTAPTASSLSPSVYGRAVERIRAAVRGSLRPTAAVDLANHAALLALSRDSDGEMTRACGALPFFDGGTLWELQRALEREKDALSPVRRRAWDLLMESKSNRERPDISLEWSHRVPKIKQGDTGFGSREAIVAALRPTLVIERVFRWGDDVADSEETETVGSLLHVDFKSQHCPTSDEILPTWPGTPQPTAALVESLSRTLLDALEHAEEVGFLSPWDHSDDDVPSVARHQQNAYRYGFCPIVTTLAELWTRVAAENSELARRYALDWNH